MELTNGGQKVTATKAMNYNSSILIVANARVKIVSMFLHYVINKINR